ncbi:carboxylating nicotinate-nucleotide diphosphorylase [Dethiobacter alkaliphilus]|uniref:carboxylating nicotinate-nucleotide diphosphorylase n=1 Tax=Dethiobacter alkaliphilus TaxID=427926 RepID=UPI002227B975|nr:carboxylating nicotinate-nucleotide diphosphorylase [Dethiobacter alkaliphilus]MCW3491442.1 carboxylating nicotinate-nucleotide diphosphorylase [Dethiobacter alkaliphilus]
MHPLQFKHAVDAALTEDLSLGDRTTDSIFTDEKGSAKIISREEAVVAGLPVAAYVFAQVDDGVDFKLACTDGDLIKPGDVVATIEGSVASILKGERTALNFLQRMSGVATLTRQAMQEVAGTKARIVDTRKTTPGLRVLEKYAVRVGGGENHRFNLADMVMIKDNHIEGAGSITAAVERVRKHLGFPVKIEVEAATLPQVQEALDCGVDVIMLDNMNSEDMTAAVGLVNGRALVEASGGITAGRLGEVAQTGVDLISLGYLTHRYRALDLTLKLNV